MDKEAEKGYWPLTLLVAVGIVLYLVFSPSKKGAAPIYNYTYHVETKNARAGDVFVVTRVDTTEPGHETPALIEVYLSPQPTGQTAR